jgi:hypothetical protein
MRKYKSYHSKLGAVDVVRVTPKLVPRIVMARKRAALKLSRRVSAILLYGRETVGRVARPLRAAEWSARLMFLDKNIIFCCAQQVLDCWAT